MSPSKNNPENRVEEKKNFCFQCKKERKPVKLIPSVGKAKMVLMCDCGAFTKSNQSLGHIY